MKEQLVQYAMELLNLVKSGVDFALQEIPLVLQEALLYWQVMSVLRFAFFAILTAACLIAAKKFFVKANQISNYEQEPDLKKREIYKRAYHMGHEEIYTAFGAIAIAVAAIFFVIWLFTAGEATKAVFAPKLLLIEKILTIGK